MSLVSATVSKHTLRFIGHFPGELVVTTGAINRAKLQSNHHHQQPVFYRLDALPVAQPTMSKHWREKYHSMELLAPNSPGDLQTLSLTTNSSSSWLPWGGLPCLSSPSDASTPSKHWRDTISYNITWAEIKHSPFVPNIIFGSNNSLGGISLGLLGSLCVQISPASGGSVSQYSECILTRHFVGHLNIKQPIPISSSIKTIRSSWTT